MTLLVIKRIFIRLLLIVIVSYLVLCLVLYFFQEKIIFFPEKLDKGHVFSFDQSFEEYHIKFEHDSLSGLLFKADHPKGLVFYLHGNAGSLDSWGMAAKCYTDLHYDVFMLDYPGYGKSTGSIKGKAQLFGAIQAAYDVMKQRYPENKIVVLGYSIGTGPAAYLASTNQPGLLILQAPYYSLTDLMSHSYPFVPAFLLKYSFQTNVYLKSCRMPVVVFHGNRDEVIYYGSSLKLQQAMKPGDTLITLDGQGHNGMTDNPDYRAALKKMLL